MSRTDGFENVIDQIKREKQKEAVPQIKLTREQHDAIVEGFRQVALNLKAHIDGDIVH